MVQTSLCFGRSDAGSLFSSYMSAHCGRVSPNQRHTQRPGAVAGTTEQEAELEGNEPALLPNQPGEFQLSVIRVFSGLYPNLHKDSVPCWAVSGPTRCSPGVAGPRMQQGLRSPLAPHLHGTGSERRAWEGASGRAGACRHAAWCGSARPGSP